jgi:hypothetical protein
MRISFECHKPTKDDLGHVGVQELILDGAKWVEGETIRRGITIDSLCGRYVSIHLSLQ